VVRQENAAGDREPEENSENARRRRAFLLRLSPDLLVELRTWASQDLRSLNAHIEYLLREAVRKRRGQGGS
jgi:hypothetical protein